jgi:hypothetical protein
LGERREEVGKRRREGRGRGKFSMCLYYQIILPIVRSEEPRKSCESGKKGRRDACDPVV